MISDDFLLKIISELINEWRMNDQNFFLGLISLPSEEVNHLKLFQSKTNPNIFKNRNPVVSMNPKMSKNINKSTYKASRII